MGADNRRIGRDAQTWLNEWRLECGIIPIRTIVAEIPPDWEVSPETPAAMSDLLLERRSWLAAGFVTSIFPQDELF